MVSDRFVHLHAHSAFSLAEGAIPVGRLARLCAGMGMPAIAITDTNNLFAALEAAEALSGAGVQPIIGMEIALRGAAASPRTPDGRPSRIVLLAQDEAGYGRLLALSSAAFLDAAPDGDAGVELSSLLTNNGGLILLTGGPDGPIDRRLAEGQATDAAAMLEQLAEAYPGRLYVELQRHPRAGDADAEGRYPWEAALCTLAYAQGLPIVATNNPYFATPDDHLAHDALLCIAGGRYVTEAERRRVSADHWLKPPSAMAELFADLPEAVEATVEIARRCAFRPRTMAPILPRFAGTAAEEAALLAAEAESGLRARLAAAGAEIDVGAYTARLAMELDVIGRMGFAGYFLIVADFIKWAKGKRIPVGPGRGSGAGSLVAYALTITDLDPIRFGLLFERFLNPERVSMPDFDIDFCQDRRDEVIAYVRDRYGADRVAQIITFGKLQARAVLRDVGRVLQMPFGQVDRLCKLVPNNPANPVTLAEAIAGEPRFAEERARDEAVETLLTTALKLEGLYRHASTHAAGVVIGDRPLTELVPLYRDPRAVMPATQFNMKWVEAAGLVKFDFLGLKTLTVIRRAEDFLASTGVQVDLSAIPLDDAPTYAMLARGEAVGVFQLESSGMRAALRGLNADCLEDIIALVSLYRPGPMDNIPTYNDRKAGREPPDYLHPRLEGVLRETHGVIIYQEQVMQIAQILAGYSLGEADLLRRAMGKKKKEEMDRQKARFIAGAEANGVDSVRAESIFELVAKFAGYGFNKSHAAAYALVSYQTAWLKANHPAAFLAASMSLDLALTDKLAVFVDEAKRMQVTVHRPCINRSQADFSVLEGGVVYGLAAVKGVGREAMEHVVEVRTAGGPFRDILDFVRRVDARRVGKRAFEQLARAGAFDVIHPNRAQLMAHADFLLRLGVAAASAASGPQAGLFGDSGDSLLSPPVLPAVDDWPALERLDHERASIGFYLSGHPLEDYDMVLAERGAVSFAEVSARARAQGRAIVPMAGIVREVKRRRSKKNTPFAWVTLSDREGDFEVTVFAELLRTHGQWLEAGARLLLTVSAEDREGDVRLAVEAIRPLDDIRPVRAVERVRVVVETAAALQSIRRRLANAAGAAPGAGGTLVLVLPLPHLALEVELSLDGAIPATAATRGLLRTIEGVAQVSFG